MSQWWDSLTLLQRVLALVAIPSSLWLVLQTVLMLFGLGGHGDVDAGHDAGGVGHDLPGVAVATGHSDLPSHLPSHVEHSVSHGEVSHAMDHLHPSAEAADTAAFHLFSLRSILAFFVLFGWVGLAMTSGDASGFVSVLVAFLAGSAGLFLTAYLFYAMQKLQYRGNLDLRNAVGKIGQVYIPIPASFGGAGKVNVLVQGRWVECDAQTAGGALKTGQSVRVVEVRAGTILVVEPE